MLFRSLMFPSHDIKGGVMKDNYVGVDLSKNLNNDSIPVILGTDNCRILGEAKSVDKYVANMRITKINCTIDGEEYESRDIKAWVMKDNYVGVDLSKKEVEKRDDYKTSETDYKQSLYGLNPGQEVKLFIEEGTLNKL